MRASARKNTFWRTFARFSILLTITRDPCKLEGRNFDEGGIFLVQFYKRNRINFDCIEAYVAMDGGLWLISSKGFQLVCNGNRAKELKIHAE